MVLKTKLLHKVEMTEYLGTHRNFIYLSEEVFVSLYKTLVRSHLEYANSVWNPYRIALIKDLEKVKMRATVV